MTSQKFIALQTNAKRSVLLDDIAVLKAEALDSGPLTTSLAHDIGDVARYSAAKLDSGEPVSARPISSYKADCKPMTAPKRDRQR